MREWKVTDGYKVKADELSWEELKNATENVIEEKRKSHRIVVLDGYGLNPGDLSWEGIERMGEFTVYDRTSVDEIVSRAALATAAETTSLTRGSRAEGMINSALSSFCRHPFSIMHVIIFIYFHMHSGLSS